MNATNQTPGQPYFWGDDMPGASPGKRIVPPVKTMQLQAKRGRQQCGPWGA